MKLRLLIGGAMILLGGVVLARGLSYTTRTDVVDMSGVRVSVAGKKPVPTWVGGLVAVAGIVLVLSGPARRG